MLNINFAFLILFVLQMLRPMTLASGCRWIKQVHYYHCAQSTGTAIVASRLDFRALATSANSSTSGDPSKPKPKAATPLRRSASKSLPIRANPTPTRSDIQPVFTLATAERYILSRLRGRLPPHAQTLHESWWVPKWGEKGKEGEIFVFANGSLVCWGLGEVDAAKFAQKVISKSNAQVGLLKEAETEELEFVTDPTELGEVRIQETYGSDLASVTFLKTGIPDCKET